MPTEDFVEVNDALIEALRKKLKESNLIGTDVQWDKPNKQILFFAVAGSAEKTVMTRARYGFDQLDKPRLSQRAIRNVIEQLGVQADDVVQREKRRQEFQKYQESTTQAEKLADKLINVYFMNQRVLMGLSLADSHEVAHWLARLVVDGEFEKKGEPDASSEPSN